MWLNLSNNIFSDFIQLWTIKEAYVKMNGLGIRYGLDTFYVDMNKKIIFDMKTSNYNNYSLLNINNKYTCCIVPKFNIVNILRYNLL